MGAPVLIQGQTGLSLSWAGNLWAGAVPWQRKGLRAVGWAFLPVPPPARSPVPAVASARAGCAAREHHRCCARRWDRRLLSWGGITPGKRAEVGLILPSLIGAKKALQGALVISKGEVFS